MLVMTIQTITKEAKKEGVTEKMKAVEEAVKEIKGRYGDGSIMKLGDVRKMDVASISTGSVSLDIALGVGGVPRGRIVEIFGPEASGKTTLAQHIVAQIQKEGGIAAFVDTEHAMDPDYAKKIGVKIDDLLISQPDTGEQALEIVETLVRSGAVDVIVIDSVAALTPRAEIEGEMGDTHVALQARLMSQALRKLTAISNKTLCTVIFTNQIRVNIGPMAYTNPTTTPGGKALKFYASVRLEVRRIAQIKQGERIIGSRTKVKVVKNKVAPPFQVAEFDIMYGEGISLESDVVNAGAKYDIVNKSGSTYTYNEQKLGVGLENSRKFLKENPKITKEIASKIKAAARESLKS